MLVEDIYTHLPERENNPQTFVYERDILAEAQVSLKMLGSRWRNFGGQIFLIGQLFVYKTPFDLWFRNR